MERRGARFEQRRAHDRKRGRDQPWRALYKDRRWLSGRLEHLADQPLCERCRRDGIVTPATVVHHRIRHQGDVRLFFDRTHWESACKPCHDGEIQREEVRGHVAGCDEEGRPLDPNHPWNRG